MKKWIAMLCAVLMVASMAACSANTANDGKYTIGICQQMSHPALDAATDGFIKALTEAVGEDNLTFKKKDAAGEYANCGTIMDGFVAENVDLILANATYPLVAAASATGTIPVLGTSITDYATALNIKDWNGTVGGNISGTTDLAPLEDQAKMILELFPTAKKVGLVYCSAEPNSVFQVTKVQEYLEAQNIVCERYSFADANELTGVVQSACDGSDVLYIPTDNTAAANAGTVGNVVVSAKKPVVCGEANTCAKCGVATLSIDYYDLGYTTGQMAAKILKGEADISTMAVQAAPEVTRMYNKDICTQLGISIPEGYTAIGE